MSWRKAIEELERLAREQMGWVHRKADMPSNVVDMASERERIARERWLVKHTRPMTRGMEGALEAIHGPPPTPEQLAEDRSRIAKQRARDEGEEGGLF